MASEKKLEIFSDNINEEIMNYSSKLKMCEESYKEMRKNLIDQYIKGRKEQRNIKWYLKRLRMRYFMIIANAIKNNKKYKNLVLDYIEKG